MKVAEIYESVQGEGFLTGQDSAFVRVSGCNLRCGFCDTPYASWAPEGEDRSIDEILHALSNLRCSHIVITGGEPMLFSEVIPLCDALRRQKKHITIETAGTLYLPLECDLMSISPKLSNSTPSLQRANKWRKRHERTRFAPDVIRKLVADYPYQFKFVIESPDDCDEVIEYLQLFPSIESHRVMLMPQGVEDEHLEQVASWLVPYCDANGFLFCPRKHIEWYGLSRGT